MKPAANFVVISNKPGKYLIIKDIGPWDKYMTVTNAAEEVVEFLHSTNLLSNNQRLLYYDSEGDLDELLVSDGKFAGFKALKCEHAWVGQQVGGSPVEASSTEWVEFCEFCGKENNM